MSKPFFNEEQGSQIVEAIKAAELNTSGEIVVHVEEKAEPDVLTKAQVVFDELELHKTAKRNAVLFYIASKSKQFAIWGDEGINAAVPEDFWNTVSSTITENFKAGNMVEGLVAGITMAGEKLKNYFPIGEDDVNELADDITDEGDVE